MSVFFCVVLSCVGSDLATGRSPVQGVLPKCPKIDLYFQNYKELPEICDSGGLIIPVLCFTLPKI
jgi:hypothetical protein